MSELQVIDFNYNLQHFFGIITFCFKSIYLSQRQLEIGTEKLK